MHENSAGDIFQNPLLGRGFHFDEAQVFLGREVRFGGFVEGGRGDDFEEELVHLLGGFGVDGAVHADHAAEG